MHTSRLPDWKPAGHAGIWLWPGAHLAVLASLLLRLYQPASGTGYVKLCAKSSALGT